MSNIFIGYSMHKSGIRRTCPLCNSIFYLCSCCDRWHVYCTTICAQEARRRSKQKANAAYQRTPNGREANRRAQQKYRKNKKTVIDQSSARSTNVLSISPSQNISRKEKNYEFNFSIQTTVENQSRGIQISKMDNSHRSTHHSIALSPKPIKANKPPCKPKPLGYCRVCGCPIFHLYSHDSYPGGTRR